MTITMSARAIRIRNGKTKTDKGCWKPIPPDMIEYFKNIPKDCPYLFYRPEMGKDGAMKYYPLGDFKKAWSNVLKAAGISDFHFHDAQHLAATDMVNAGNADRAVSDIARWAAGS